jgi:hypothetical protein
VHSELQPRRQRRRRVILHRAADRSGPFAPVANHSSIMSPGNRSNPDFTNPLGLFGWDVLPGFYKVTAQHAGCTAVKGHKRAASTGVLTVPPPALNLNVRLKCPHLQRSKTKLDLRVRKSGAGRALVVHVLGTHRHRPTGVLVFRSGARSLTLPISPRTSLATVVLTRKGHERVSVRYLGDGYDRPSHKSARV